MNARFEQFLDVDDGGHVDSEPPSARKAGWDAREWVARVEPPARSRDPLGAIDLEAAEPPHRPGGRHRGEANLMDGARWGKAFLAEHRSGVRGPQSRLVRRNHRSAVD